MAKNMTIKITDKSNLQKEYPLKAANLKFGQFAEAKNGTIVVRIDSQALNNAQAYEQIICLENGLGGYSSESKFRLIPNHLVEFETGADSRAQYREG